MNFKLAVLLDVYLGRLLLAAISLLPPYPRNGFGREPVARILVIKFWGIGSILEATPLFRALKQKWPEAQLDLLTFAENRRMAESLGLFHEVRVLQIKKGFFSLAGQLYRLFLNCRHSYDIIIDLEFFANFSALVTKLLCGKYSLGFEGFFHRRNFCYSRTVIFDHSSHVRTIFLKIINALNAGPPEPDQSLSTPEISDTQKASVRKKVPQLYGPGPHIAININSSALSLNRRWPREHFITLIQLMTDDLRPQIYLIGSANEVPFVSGFAATLSDQGGVHILAGQLDIIEFAHALECMDLLITSDSGPVHIAEAMHTPVACFFGPETPNLYGPQSDHSLTFYTGIYCSPCLNTYNFKRSKCRDNQCLKQISAKEVYAAIRDKFFAETVRPSLACASSPEPRH